MSKTKRMAIIFIAVLFLATSVAFSVMVFMQITGDDQDNTRSLEDVATEQAEQQNQGEMLQGTTLESFETRESVDELEVIDIQEGDGDTVQEGASVTAHYTGAFADNGEIFQSSKDTGQPVPFSLDSVIQGWTEGVPGMKVGGVRRLVIPAEKAYGSEGALERDAQGNPTGEYSIPPNKDLVFDIELVDIQQ